MYSVRFRKVQLAADLKIQCFEQDATTEPCHRIQNEVGNNMPPHQNPATDLSTYKIENNF